MAPRYLSLLETGELRRRADLLSGYYKNCTLCPFQCGVDRTAGERGVCGQSSRVVVASYNVHHGEEPPISGTAGSGTIFFSGCSGRCIYCQNYPISQFGNGNEVTTERLAGMMLELQERGCHNINLVTPTHFIPSIAAALAIAAVRGLRIPIVYNTSGYERPEIIELLDGIVDIYLPDAKYADDSIAREISGFRGYVGYNREALRKMHGQVGDLVMENETAVKGLIIRHLVLPGDMSGTENVLEFISRALGPGTYVSLMSQYFPAYESLRHETLSRTITDTEYERAIEAFTRCGLRNGWIQERNPQ